MTAIDESKVRFETIRRCMDSASAALWRDDLQAVAQLCESVLATLESIVVSFRHDWLSLDLTISTLVTSRAWAERRPALSNKAEGLRPLLKRAVELRLRWIVGEED